MPETTSHFRYRTVVSLRSPAPLVALLALLAVGAGWPRAALSALHNLAPLNPLPSAKVQALAPMLRKSDLALIESAPGGMLKQITILTLVAAPPALVRQVVLQPERYSEFVRNMTKSEVAKLPDGTLEHTYELSYKVFSIDGKNRVVALPADGNSEAPPVQMYDPDESWSGNRQYRWEFYPAGGGTLIAMYGYTNVLNSNGVVSKVLKRFPSLEHGMALVSQMTLALAMKARAEQLAGPAITLPAAAAASINFLLERGPVAILRTQAGRLSEVSLITASEASPSALLDVAGKPEQWSQFIPTISQSVDAGTQDGIRVVQMEQSLPLLSFKTEYGMRTSASAVDLMGLSGDLRGARLRWDIGQTQQGRTQLVLRASQTLDQASLVLRQLYRLEPLFEYGINVGLDLLLLNSIKTKAEQPRTLASRTP